MFRHRVLPILGVLMLGACSTVQPARVIPLRTAPLSIPLPKAPEALLLQVEPPTKLPGKDGEPLTPDQLFEGYANLAEYDRILRGEYTGLQNWVRDRLGAQ